MAKKVVKKAVKKIIKKVKKAPKKFKVIADPVIEGLADHYPDQA